ncbi:hypothetical protein TNCV_1903051 [Trichonephila clavipes]|nr:hypothetical protein TNCV_1903051 [Trichonephila clavipes]
MTDFSAPQHPVFFARCSQRYVPDVKLGEYCNSHPQRLASVQLKGLKIDSTVHGWGKIAVSVSYWTRQPKEGNEIADTLTKAGACEVPEPSAPLTFSLEPNTRIRPLGLPPEQHWYQCSRP